jgi:hypothetical protein
MNLFHAFPVLAIHEILSALPKLPADLSEPLPERRVLLRSHPGAKWERFPVCMSFGN